MKILRDFSSFQFLRKWRHKRFVHPHFLPYSLSLSLSLLILTNYPQRLDQLERYTLISYGFSLSESSRWKKKKKQTRRICRSEASFVSLQRKRYTIIYRDLYAIYIDSFRFLHRRTTIITPQVAHQFHEIVNSKKEYQCEMSASLRVCNMYVQYDS